MLCPSIFTGKKKYFGVVYKPERNQTVELLDRINIKKDTLIKGIDFIKSQYPQIIKEAGFSLLDDIMNRFNQMLRDCNPCDQQTDLLLPADVPIAQAHALDKL